MILATKNYALLLGILTATFTQIWCQEADTVSGLAQPSRLHIEHPNAVKLNLAAAYFNKVTLFYEREINGKWSLNLGMGYKFGGEIPKWAGMGNFVVSSKTGGISGYSLAPEVRYKIWNNDCEQQSGFYAGLYGVYSKLFGELVFKYWDGGEYIDVGGAGDMFEYGFGLQLGYQLNFGEHWLIDFMFLGPRLSQHKIILELDSQFASEVIPQIEEELNRRLENLGYDPVSIPTDTRAEIDFGFKNFRYALAVGYRF